MNPAAHALLAARLVVLDRNGHLRLGSQSTSLAIDELVRRAWRDRHPKWLAVALGQDHWLVVAAYREDAVDGSILIRCREITADDAVDLTPLAHLFMITASELPVLKGLFLAHCPKQISQSLDLSLHTIRSHLRSIYGKLGVKSSAEAQLKLIRLYYAAQFD